MRYSSGAHTRFYHRFHVVWVTKYRFKVLQGAMRERLIAERGEAFADYATCCLEIWIWRDHTSWHSHLM